MAEIAPQPSPTESGNGGGGAPRTSQSSRSPSTSSPRTPNSSILLPVLSEVTPSHGGGGGHGSGSPSRGSPRPSILDGSSRSRSLGMPMSSYPPRSAAISSRRGRSRSPTTTSVDRRSSSLSHGSSTMGLIINKHSSTVADHPAEQANGGGANANGGGGGGGGRTIDKQDSRDDVQSLAKSPVNVSSAAAAAAAAAAASLASNGAAKGNSNNNKRSRDEEGSSDAIPTIGTDDFFSQPPRKQGKTGDCKKEGGDDNPSWPVSPVGPNKASASAVTSSSSTSGLSPIKMEEKGQTGQVHRTRKLLTHSLDTPPASCDTGREKAPIKDDTAAAAAKLIDSPLDPPEIQNSHRDEQPKNFSPKAFFEDDKAGAKSTTFTPLRGIETAPSNAAANGAAGIEMSASFTLFNHSFDSLGGVMPDLDAGALNSFGGIGAANSTDVGAPVPSMSLSFLRQDSTKSPKTPKLVIKDGQDDESGRNKSKGRDEFSNTQILDGSSSGGGSMKLLGLSPNHSFGGGIMPVGGENAEMADLVLNGGVVTGAPFAGEHKGDHYYHRPQINDKSPAGQPPPARHYQGQQGYGGHGHAAGPPSLGVSPLQGCPGFYFVLRRWRKCFGRFTFLLPGLKVRESCSVNVSAVGNITVYSGPNRKDDLGGTKASDGRKVPYGDPRGKKFLDPNPAEIEIATRRVIAAVCAFGGSIQRAAPSSRQTSSSSIFRTKYNASGDPNLNKSQHQIKYEKHLPQRFYENENRLSWEVEEKPPVLSASDEEEAESKKVRDRGSNKKGGKSNSSSYGRGSIASKSDHYPVPSPSPTNCSTSSGGEPPKMRYRCKLCGLPKQNHTCPYQQSLQRSIGSMTYPAVNAHSSAEPGRLAPPLTEMNNFMAGEEGGLPPNDNSPPRMKNIDASTVAGSYHIQQGIVGSPHNVTPESMRSSLHMHHSPASSLSGTPESTPFRRIGHRGRTRFSPQRQMRRGEHSKMQGFGDELSAHPLFIETMEIRPEQFRTVTPMKSGTKRGAYTYPSLPLPYGQRKRLSDSLFAMSKEVPGLTDECAVVLREARQKGKWDLAVAELMTQVVITVHCRDGDNTLEGLRHYLLTLGIAC